MHPTPEQTPIISDLTFINYVSHPGTPHIYMAGCLLLLHAAEGRVGVRNCHLTFKAETSENGPNVAKKIE